MERAAGAEALGRLQGPLRPGPAAAALRQERKREEAARRKAELKKLAAEEEAQLAAAGKKKAPQKLAGPKVRALGRALRQSWNWRRADQAPKSAAAGRGRPATLLSPRRPCAAAPAQVTAHQLTLTKEQEAREEERQARERADAAKRMVSRAAALRLLPHGMLAPAPCAAVPRPF